MDIIHKMMVVLCGAGGPFPVYGTILDPITELLYEFCAISSSEYQFGRNGNIPTNYTLDAEAEEPCCDAAPEVSEADDYEVPPSYPNVDVEAAYYEACNDGSFES